MFQVPPPTYSPCSMRIICSKCLPSSLSLLLVDYYVLHQLLSMLLAEYYVPSVSPALSPCSLQNIMFQVSPHLFRPVPCGILCSKSLPSSFALFLAEYLYVPSLSPALSSSVLAKCYALSLSPALSLFLAEYFFPISSDLVPVPHYMFCMFYYADSMI